MPARTPIGSPCAPLVGVLLLTACGAATTLPAAPSVTPTLATTEAAASAPAPASVAVESASPSVTTAVEPATLLRVQAAGVRLRTDPTTNAQLVRPLPAGAKVSVISGPVARDGHEWYEVAHGEATGWVAIGPERDWLAVIRNGRIAFGCVGCDPNGSAGFMTVQADGSDPRVVSEPFTSPAWSPDGARVAVTSRAQTTSEDRVLVLSEDAAVLRDLGHGLGPVWSPDGTRLAFVNPAERTIVIVEEDGTQVGVVVSDVGVPRSLTWSPDGRRLAFVDVDCPECRPGQPIVDPPVAVFVFEPPGGAVVKLADGGNTGIVHWSADGARISFLELDLSTGKHDLREVDLETGVVITTDSGQHLVYGYSISPDEKRVAFGTRNGIVVAARNGDDAMLIVRNDESTGLMPQHPRWSPDGQWLVYDIVATRGDAIYAGVVRADGTDGRRLADSDAYNADWQPILDELTPATP